VKYCDGYVCLSVHSRDSKTTQPNLCILPTTVALFSSDIVAIYFCRSSFVDDVMFSLLPYGMSCIPEWQQNMTTVTAKIPAIFCSTIKTSRYSS